MFKMANSVDPDQTYIGAVCSESTMFASILNLSVMLGNYLQQTTSADDIFRSIFFLGALRVKHQNKGTKNMVALILLLSILPSVMILTFNPLEVQECKNNPSQQRTAQ